MSHLPLSTSCVPNHFYTKNATMTPQNSALVPIKRTAKTLIILGGCLSLRWAHSHFVGFVKSRLRSRYSCKKSAAWQNQQNVHPESPLSTWRSTGPLATHKAQSEDWSDWVDAQADLSLRWPNKSNYWFCNAPAYLKLRFKFHLLLRFIVILRQWKTWHRD